MKVSVNWLKDYIDLKGISVSEIIDKLTISGLEVEEVFYQEKKYENIIIGYTTEVKKHPNADKLSVCKVSDGKEEFNVVCGAPNVTAGQKVAFAKVGAIIPKNRLMLSQVKIRGQVSNGMICSEDELELGSDHEGIIVFDPKIKTGIPLSKALGLNDIILEVAITPNRSDALSHIGIAKDLSAIFNRKLKLPKIKIKESKIPSGSLAKIEIKDKQGCPRYVGKVISNITIKESPDWLKTRLKNIGLRPINNVVDVTNFVLYEIGQPLHAFDLNLLAGQKIIVRKAGSDKKFISLDSKERILDSHDLMICDAQKPVAIAGIMGGENSEVTNETKNLLIESAFFNPSRIRKTAKNLGLSTDASYRFERGTDPEVTRWASRRAVQLIYETAGGNIAKGEIDINPVKTKKLNINLRFSRITKILGYQIPNSTIIKILKNLGFEVTIKGKDLICVTVPTSRHDIAREIDLIEEVARIYGYDKIPTVSKIAINLEEKIDNSQFNNNVRQLLASFGLYEILTNSFISADIAKSFGNPVKILNPQNSEMSTLRTSLLPGVLTTISNNLKVNEKDLKIFEIGKVFELKTKEVIKNFKDFSETEHILIAITGNAFRSEWYEKDRSFDIYDVIGLIENFLLKMYPNSKIQSGFATSDLSFLDHQLEIVLENKAIGICGKIKREINAIFDVAQDVFAVQLNLDIMKEITPCQKSFKELLKYPKVYRDAAFIFDKNITVGEVIAAINHASTNLLHNIKLFDIFQSESLGKDKKSFALQFEFYDVDKTLTEEEVEKEFAIIINTVTRKFNSQLRGS